MSPHITTRLTTTTTANDHAIGPTPAQQRGINGHRPFTICVDAGATKTHAALVFTDAAQEAGGGSENLFETMVGCGSCSALGPYKSSETLRSAVVSVLNQAGIVKQNLCAAPRGQDAATPPPSPCDDDSERLQGDDEQRFAAQRQGDDEQRFAAQRHGDGSSTLYQDYQPQSQPLRNCQALWIGVAGISSPEVEDDVRQHAIQWLEPLGLDIAGGRLFLGNDALLLGAPLLEGAQCCASSKAICLIAGTGSIGFALGIDNEHAAEEELDASHSSSVTSTSGSHNFGGEDTVMVELPTQLAKTDQKPRLLTPDNLTTLAQAGGWGYLLGDEGSAFHIGLSALRLLLRREEERVAAVKRQRKRGSSSALAAAISPSTFEQQACNLLGVPSPQHLIEATYASPPDCFKHWVARLCPLVFAYAFPSDDRGSYDEQSHLLALSLVKEAAKGLVGTGERLLRAAAVAEDDDEASDPMNWTLVVAGGLFANSPAFVELLLETWREKRRANHHDEEEAEDEQAMFAAVRVLTHPAIEGAKALAASVTAAAGDSDHDAPAAAIETTSWWGKLPQAWLGW